MTLLPVNATAHMSVKRTVSHMLRIGDGSTFSNNTRSTTIASNNTNATSNGYR